MDGAGRAPPPSDRPARGDVVDEVLGGLVDELPEPLAGTSAAVLSCGDAMAKPPASTRPDVTATPPATRRARRAGCLVGCMDSGGIPSIVDHRG